MKKVLFLSNTANFSKFNLPYMRWFREQRWRVDYASAGEETVPDCDNQFSICIARSPFSFKNIRAYRQLKKNSGGKRLRHSALPYADGRRNRKTRRQKAPPCGQNQGDLYRARIPFLQGRAASQLAPVLSGRKMARPLHGRDCNDKRGRL